MILLRTEMLQEAWFGREGKSWAHFWPSDLKALKAPNWKREIGHWKVERTAPEKNKSKSYTDNAYNGKHWNELPKKACEEFEIKAMNWTLGNTCIWGHRKKRIPRKKDEESKTNAVWCHRCCSQGALQEGGCSRGGDVTGISKEKEEVGEENNELSNSLSSFHEQIVFEYFVPHLEIGIWIHNKNQS